MSQFPNQPPMNPPQPYVQPGMPGERPRASAAAIASLIFGILGCVPFLTSILAVILGIVGIRKTRDPRYTGKGIAIAGLILGLLGIVGWGTMGGGVYALYVTSRPVASVAQQFVKDVDAANLAAASAKAESTVTPAELQTLAEQFKQWGHLQDLTIPSRTVESTNGQTTWTLVGVARFGSGTKAATIKLRKQPDGTFKVSSANFE